MTHLELVERVRAGLVFGSVNDPNSDTGAYAALSSLVEQHQAFRELLREAEPVLELRGYPGLALRIRETLGV